MLQLCWATKIGSKGRQRRFDREGKQTGAGRQILIQAVRCRSRLKFKQRTSIATGDKLSEDELDRPVNIRRANKEIKCK